MKRARGTDDATDSKGFDCAAFHTPSFFCCGDAQRRFALLFDSVDLLSLDLLNNDTCLTLCAHSPHCSDGEQTALSLTWTQGLQLQCALDAKPVLSIDLPVIEQALDYLCAKPCIMDAFEAVLTQASTDHLLAAEARLGAFACRRSPAATRWVTTALDHLQIQSLMACGTVPYGVRCEFVGRTVQPPCFVFVEAAATLNDEMLLLRPWLVPDQVVLAGGSALALLPEAAWLTPLNSSDCDVFVLASAPAGTLTGMAQALEKKGYSLWRTHKTIVTAIGPWPRRPVQLIWSHCASTHELLLDFDLEVVRVAYDGSHLCIGSGVWHDLHTRTLTHKSACSVKAPRLAKMALKGFSLQPEAATYVQKVLGWPLTAEQRLVMTNLHLCTHPPLSMDAYFAKLGFTRTWTEETLRKESLIYKNCVSNLEYQNSPQCCAVPWSCYLKSLPAMECTAPGPRVRGGGEVHMRAIRRFTTEPDYQRRLYLNAIRVDNPLRTDAPNDFDHMMVDIPRLRILFVDTVETRPVKFLCTMLHNGFQPQFLQLCQHLVPDYEWEPTDCHDVRLTNINENTDFVRNGLPSSWEEAKKMWEEAEKMRGSPYPTAVVRALAVFESAHFYPDKSYRYAPMTRLKFKVQTLLWTDELTIFYLVWFHASSNTF